MRLSGRAGVWTLVLVLVTAVGCELGPQVREIARPASPFQPTGIEKMAVVVLNATENPTVNELEVAQIFSTELQQFAGVKVFPAAVVEAAARTNRLVMPQQAGELGRELNVDAVIVVFINEWDPYDVPSVGMMVLMYDTRNPAPAAQEGQAPAVVKPMVVLERVYDSDQQQVMAQVEQFAASRNAGKSPMGAKSYVMVMSNYLHFVSDRVVRDLFAQVGGSVVQESPSQMGGNGS